VKLSVFRLGDYGIPYGYSPLLLANTATTLWDSGKREEVVKLLRCVARGYKLLEEEGEDALEVRKVQ